MKTAEKWKQLERLFVELSREDPDRFALWLMGITKKIPRPKSICRIGTLDKKREAKLIADAIRYHEK